MGYSFYLTNFSFRTVANAFLRSGDLVNLVNNVPEVCSHRRAVAKLFRAKTGLLHWYFYALECIIG